VIPSYYDRNISIYFSLISALCIYGKDTHNLILQTIMDEDYATSGQPLLVFSQIMKTERGIFCKVTIKFFNNMLEA
jgi:hypothetical protein